jgi:two-component system cell cycle sensor histidine kinase/response regulator CckA
VDLANLLNQWTPELGWKLGGERLDLELGEVPMVNADSDRLRTVLGAILDNSREAMEEAGLPEGRVRLRLFVDFGEDRPGTHSAGVWVADPPAGLATVCLEVADEGPGAGPEILSRMFDPFFTTKALGRGLGLASALGLLQAHRAGVHVLPGKEQGLVFRIHFPPAGS